jgi:putative transposase
MRQRWKYRAYPTKEQEKILAQTFGCVRYVYNWALAARTKAFKGGGRMTYKDSDAALTVLKRQSDTIWLNDVHSTPLQQTLRDLQSAFSGFFDRRTGYPSFKKKGARGTARYSKSGFKLTDGRRLSIGKLGVLRLRWDRSLPSAPSSITLIREPSGRYYVSFVVEVVSGALPKTGATVGVDFGISRLATLSKPLADGRKHIANPKHGRSRAERLALLQRRLARKQKGSRRRMLAKRAVARCHEKISNARKDALNKLTTRFVTEFDVICIEDLNLRGMVKNHSLARSLSDAGIGMAVRMLEEKAERYGKRVQRVDRWFPSSKMCSCCGYVLSVLPVSVRDWTCPKCDAVHDRDDNAALNIEAVGQTASVRGDGVRSLSVSTEGDGCR